MTQFDEMFEAAKAAKRERAKAIREIEQPDEPTPESRIKYLRKVAADPSESYSIRQDAMRLIQVADLRPKDFEREYSDFIQWRSETRK